MTILKFFRPNIIKLCTKFSNKFDYILTLQLHSNIFLLDVNFEKSTIEIHFLLISSMLLAKFQENQRSMTM